MTSKTRMKSAKQPARRSSASEIQIVRESRPRVKPSSRERDEALDARHTGVTYSTGRSNPYSTRLGGALVNPDPVLMQNGGDASFYDGILFRHPYAAGCLDQKVERANKPRIIVAGDPSDARSVAIAEEARRHWRKVPSLPVVLARWARNADFIGYGALEKVFTRDSASGLVYVSRLIDRKCQNVKFRDDGTALWLSARSPYDGEVIPKRKMSFLRGGSINSPYGDGNAPYIYPATYLIEKTVELMLDSVEEFARPIPTVYMPRAKEALSPAEREKVRAYARAVHSRYIEIPTDGITAKVEMTNAPMASAGQIGSSEMAIIEMLVTWIYIRMIRVAQTMNKTGGSRALEDTRYDITDDASRPLCVLIDGGLNEPSVPGDEYTGWMTDFNDFNFPDEPEEILPRFDTPTLSQDDIAAIHDRAMDMIDRGLGDDLSRDWLLRVTGAEQAKNDGDRLRGTPAPTRASDRRAERGTEKEPTSIREVAERANLLARQLDAMVGLAA